MTHKTLKTGFQLPAVGLGTWLMGGDAKGPDTQNDEREIAAIRAALEAGFTHIDTAEIYGLGHSEELVAEATRGFPREKLILATKAVWTHHRYDDLLRSLEASLKRLKQNCVDIYYLHAHAREVPLKETAQALNRAIEEGRIKHIAVSNFLPATVDELQSHLDTRIVANQVHYNLIFREADRVGLFEHAQKNDYFVVAWRPVRFFNRHKANGHPNLWEAGAYPLVERIAAKHGMSSTQVGIRWILSKPNTVVLFKSSQPERLLEARKAAELELGTDDLAALEKDFKPIEYTSDTVPLG